MINMSEITAVILGGTIMMVTFLYFVTILFMILKASRGHLRSDSKGMKSLKHQKWNYAWNKFVLRSGKSKF